MYVYLYASCVCGFLWRPDEVETLELQLQAFLSHLVWVQRVDCGPLEEQQVLSEPLMCPSI